MKAMEGIVVSYDGTVRNSNRHLVQLSYGEDGMDGAFMEFQQLPGIKPSDSAFKRRFYFDCSDQRYMYILVHVYMCSLVPYHVIVCVIMYATYVKLYCCTPLQNVDSMFQGRCCMEGDEEYVGSRDFGTGMGSAKRGSRNSSLHLPHW